MSNLHERLSFSEYIYRIKLKNILNEKTNQDNINYAKDLTLNSSILYSQLDNFESITFSVDKQNYVKKNCDDDDYDDDHNNHVIINIDSLKCINQCLLTTNQSKYQLPTGIKCRGKV
ncbi:unnamed protein product [Schistosoma turkestanicum]|nr:unnamed protein product [Schistosoma turkestanicum]